MPPKSKLNSRKSLGVNASHFKVNDSDDEDSVAPVGVPLRRSGRSSTDSNQQPESDLDLRSTSRVKTSTNSTKGRNAIPATKAKPAKRSRSAGNKNKGEKQQGDESEQGIAEEDGSEIINETVGGHSVSVVSIMDDTMDTSEEVSGRGSKRSKIVGVGSNLSSVVTKSAPSRGGVVPRAAKILNKAPPDFSRTMEADGSGDDGEAPLMFSTHPPTPGAAIVSENRKGKRKAAAGKVNQEAEGSRAAKSIRQDEPQASTSKSSIPAPSTPARSRTKLPHTHDPTTDGVAPITRAETPSNMKMLVSRSTTKRRQSLDTRGKRASMVGTGLFPTLPHPDVPSDKLYRSVDPTLPLSHRLRPILSWIAMRQRDATFPAGAEPATTGRGPTAATTRFAQRMIDEWIVRLTASDNSSRLDLTLRTPHVPLALDPNASRATTPAPLSINPQNEAIEAKWHELNEIANTIALEEANREQVYGRYDLARSRLADGFSTSAPSNIVTSLLPAFDTLAVNYDVSASNPTSLAEAIALGKSLIESKPAVPVATKKGAKKGKGKGKEREKDLSMVIEEVDDLETKMTEIRLQCATFRDRTHKLDQFTRQAGAYIASRQTDAHQRLTIDAADGLLSVPLSETFDRTSSKRGPIAEVVRDIQGLIGSGSTSGGEQLLGGGVDCWDLLRAIARADGARGVGVRV